MKQLLLLIFLLCLCNLNAFCGASGRSDGSEMKPTLKDIPYGEDELQKLDIYLPEGDGPFPYIVNIHGGGWWNGDKQWQSEENIGKVLSAGCAYVAINYRFLPQAWEEKIFPPVRVPYHDARLALQFTRFHAEEYKLNPEKVVLYGGSAGACTSLWLALSPEMADRKSKDPVGQMSTKVLAVGTEGAQTSLDPIQMREWVGVELKYGGHAFGLEESDFDGFMKRRSDLKRYFKKLSPASLVNKKSPPIFLSYDKSPDEPDKDHMYYVHSPLFGIGFQQLALKKGAVCYLEYPGLEPECKAKNVIDFLIQSLIGK